MDHRETVHQVPGKVNRVLITRVPGKGTRLSLVVRMELDASDPEAMSRLGRSLRELVPEEDRSELLDDLVSAAKAAGILVSLQEVPKGNPG